MFVLHGIIWVGEIHAWAETRCEPATRRRGKGVHPYCAKSKVVAESLGLEAGRAKVNVGLAWLPSVDRAPLPSSPILGSIESKKPATIAPWKVDVLKLSPSELLRLASALDADSDGVPGVVPAASIHYCLHVARFALSMVVRQQMIPDLHDSNAEGIPRWSPVFLGEDRERLEKLSAAMPPMVRSFSGPESPEPSAHPTVLLRDAIGGLVDSLARPDVRWEKHIVSKRSSVHQQWADGLSTAHGVAIGKESELARLRSALEQWKHPLLALSTATHRLAFRLEEPEDGAEKWTLRPLLQPLDDQSLLLDVDVAWKKNAKAADLKTFALSELGNASGVFPPIRDLLKGRRPKPLWLDGEGALDFLTLGASALEQSGFRVLLPSWWTRTGTKQRLVAKGKARSSTSKSTSVLSMESLVRFSWELAIGDKSVTIEELQALAESKSPLVKIRGQWVHVNVDQIRSALAFWKQKGGERELSLSEVMRLSLGIGDESVTGGLAVEEITGTGNVGKFLREFRDAGMLKVLDAPEGFRAQLRPYQLRGYSWLQFFQTLGMGVCLADDMGLGKTIQALALLQGNHGNGAAGPVLVVCPTSVLGNWQREAQKFATGLRVMLHHGTKRPKTAKAMQKVLDHHDMVVTTYALLQRDITMFSEVPWRVVILDEAQYIKNHDTRQAKAARTLKADFRLAMSGTPVENHVGELWSIMEFLNPGLLGTRAHFDRTYQKPIQQQGSAEAAEALRRATGPFILRRLKTDRTIIADLPDKIENTVYCQLTKEQGSLYAAALKDVEKRLEDTDGGIERKGLILGLLSRLKQICNHPAQFLGDQSAIGGRSGKLTRLVEMIGEMIEQGERALVFTQFTEMGDLIKPHLEDQFGREVLYLKGSVSKKKRDEMVRHFQEDASAPPVFLLSLRAGGTGLTLTRASHVFHFDRWWNPAVENQATDRAFRIGQKSNVQVHKFVCMGTVEERIDEMIRAKSELAEKIVGSGEGWITELSNRELRDLVALGKDAVVE